MPAVVPWVVDVQGHERRAAVRLAVAAGLLLAAAVVAARAGRAGGTGADGHDGTNARRLPPPVRWAWAALGAVTALATAAAPDPLLGLLGDPVRLGGLVTLGVLFTAFALAHRAGSGLLPPLALALAAGALPTAACAIAQWVGVGGHEGRATGLAGNAAFLGAHLCLAVPVAAGLALDRARPPSWRAVGGAAAVLGTAAIAASEARGAWVGVVVGLAVVTAGRVPRPALAALVVGGAAAVLLVPIGGDRGDTLDLTDGTGRGRVDTWAESVDVVLARPVLGWGPEGFRRGFAAEVDDGWVRTYGLDRLPDRAHNRFLDAAAAGGLLGLAADAALVGVVGLAVLRRARTTRGTPAHALVVAAGGGLAAWLVQGQVLFDLPDSSILAWLLAGAVLAGPTPPPTPSTPSGRSTAALLVVLALGGATLGAAGVVADRAVHASSGDPAAQALDRLHRATEVRPRSLEATLLIARVAVASEDPALLARAHSRLEGWDDPDVVLRDADVLAALARDEGSRTAHERAIARYRAGLEDWPANGPGWVGLGQALLVAGLADDARPALERAEHLLPDSSAPALNLAFLAFADGRDDEGCRWLERAAERPDAPEPAELARAAAAAGATCPGLRG